MVHRRGDNDPGTDALLDLDGEVYVVDSRGEYSVRFAVRRVPPTPERPFGLKYSLTLHGPDGNRLVGFDNAHLVRKSRGPGRKLPSSYDHKHRLSTIRPYRFRNAAALLADFWAEVDSILTERGVMER